LKGVNTERMLLAEYDLPLAPSIVWNQHYFRLSWDIITSEDSLSMLLM
jgi:hypothetical protein